MMNKQKRKNGKGPSEGLLLLPWHVTGKLKPTERKIVDAYLASDPEADMHLSLIGEERSIVAEDNDALAGAPAGALSRLHQRIEEEDGAAIESAETRASLMQGLRDLFSLRTPALRYAGIAAALVIMVQAVVIGTLLVSPERIGPFETASYPAQSQKAKGTRLLLGFEDQVPAEQITRLIREISGEVVGGPTADGIYTVRVSAAKMKQNQLDGLIERLEARKGTVRFVAESD